MKYLITGLGNIGFEYDGTRHNIGFRVLDALAKASNIVFEDKRYGFVARMRVKNAELVLLKPSTFMNLSGNAVRYWMQQEKVPLENLLVVVDDLSLPLGTIRMKPGGSAGGHNGLKSIIAHLGTDQFPRVKVGVGAPPNPEYDMADWVTGGFSAAERRVVDAALDRALDAAACVIEKGVTEAQNRFNG